MQVFYVQEIEGVAAWLEEDEMQHCVRTLRKGVGDRIVITDGKGAAYEATVLEIERRRVRLGIERPLEQGRAVLPLSLHIAIAPTKNMDRMEFLVEKATEIGVASIGLLRCRRSERKEVRVDRLEKIIQAAAKQSLQFTFPVLYPMMEVGAYIRQHRQEQNFIAHCQADDLPLLVRVCRPVGAIGILIGPEGDFSDEEIAAAEAAGFEAISLGQSRLRTETAGVVACAQVWSLVGGA